MDLSATQGLVVWALVAAAVVGGGIYLFIEYQSYLLRTKVESIPGGLRFSARGLTVEVRHAAREVYVQAQDGLLTRQRVPDGAPEDQRGAVSCILGAAGVRVAVARVSLQEAEGEDSKPTGLSQIDISGSDELLRQAQGKEGGTRTLLHLAQVPDPIATDFGQFAASLRAWVEKVEQGLEAEVAQRREQEEAAAKVAAKQELVSDAELTPEQRKERVDTQIALWRQAAGFSGKHTECQLNPLGLIDWFIDLDPAGRIIVHAGRRTFYGSLLGAKITLLANEMEISVRDDFWTEEDPRLVPFRVLGGASAQSRLDWKKRLEDAVDVQAARARKSGSAA